jgi:hypothetical protein
VTREEFIGRAADAILRYGGQDPETCPGEVTVEAVYMAQAALEAVEFFRLNEAFDSIRDYTDPDYADFPADWSAQIDACEECARWKGHPIQGGICDNHRRPLYARERWQAGYAGRFMQHALDVVRKARS